MKTGEMMKTIGVVLVGLLVLVCGVPLVLMLAGLALGAVGFFAGLAGFVIKLAVIAAVCYLALVAIKSLMR